MKWILKKWKQLKAQSTQIRSTPHFTEQVCMANDSQFDGLIWGSYKDSQHSETPEKFFIFQSLLPSKNKNGRLTLFLIYSEAAEALGPEQPHSIFVSSLRRGAKGRKMTAMSVTKTDESGSSSLTKLWPALALNSLSPQSENTMFKMLSNP